MSLDLKTKQFIKKAQKVHGNKYNYNKTIYICSKDKVIITCPKHGDFEQIASGHLRGNGCRKCAYDKLSEIKLISFDEFVMRSNNVHNKKYDYSKSNYINGVTKIEIICSKHGSFFQTPTQHMQCSGCPKCGHERTAKFNSYTKEQFIEKANNVHNWKYDYSKVEYINSTSKVCIICPEHGEFWQVANDHLRSSFGCPLCLKNIQTKQHDVFIYQAQLKHGNKFDYSKVKYINAKTKVIITCPVHGEFVQTPDGHLRGGCKKCADEKHGADKILSFDFIKKSKERFGDKFDYSKTLYVGKNKRVALICPVHGEILVIPANHLLSKTGCQLCSLETHPGKYTYKKFEKYPELANKMAKIYFLKLNNDNETFYKIGITTLNVKTRYSLNKNMISCNTKDGYSKYKFEILIEKETSLFNAYKIEQKIINEFNVYKYKPNTYMRGSSECFSHNLTNNIMGLYEEIHIRKLC